MSPMRFVLGFAAVAVLAAPAAAADLPAGYRFRPGVETEGTAWRAGPVARIWEHRDYVRVIPVYRREIVTRRWRPAHRHVRPAPRCRCR